MATRFGVPYNHLSLVIKGERVGSERQAFVSELPLKLSMSQFYMGSAGRMELGVTPRRYANASSAGRSSRLRRPSGMHPERVRDVQRRLQGRQLFRLP